MQQQNRGPSELILVRHGESLANVAASAAEAAGAEVIEIDRRDADVELSPAGIAQASALGRWFARNPLEEAPVSIWSSPYQRAARTAAIVQAQARLSAPLGFDERLRDRDLGVTDLLTSTGVRARLPQEAARRAWLGKFYYRPPGGEAWTDLALRVRSFLDHLDAVSEPGPVVLVCHDAVVLIIRFVCEQLTERQLLDIGANTPVANASVTRLIRTGRYEPWVLERFNDVGHLRDEGAPVTEHANPGQGDPHA